MQLWQLIVQQDSDSTIQHAKQENKSHVIWTLANQFNRLHVQGLLLTVHNANTKHCSSLVFIIGSLDNKTLNNNLCFIQC